jgi:phosphoserine phosphatase
VENQVQESKFMKRLVVLDVDSTMIEQEVIELLAAKAGLREQVKELTDKAMSGEIDFKQALLMRVALLEGLSDAVFEEIHSEITVTDGVKELIDSVHQSGGLVGAISGGFSQILEPLALRLGLDFNLANELEISQGILTGKILGEIVDASAKANNLLKWATEQGVDVSDTVAVGDGANDIPMLQAAGFAVAFRPKKILRQYADVVIEGNSLKPLIELLELRSS